MIILCTARRKLPEPRSSACSSLLLEILGEDENKIDLGEEPIILAADALSLAELMEMDKEKLLGIVTRKGSATSHAAILAKNMDIPCVTGIGIPQSEEEWEDSIAIIDGYTGTIYLEPDNEVRKEYEIRRKADLVERESLLKLKDKGDITKDGREVGIYANIGSLDDLNSALYYGAKGIGLLRSEFQYLGRENYPGEEELFQAYKKTAETMGDRLVVIRTADLGADKQASYLEIPVETNPLMGNRGIRLSLDRSLHHNSSPDFLKWYTSCLQLFFYFRHQSFNLIHFLFRTDHMVHHPQIAIPARTVNGTDLGFKQVLGFHSQKKSGKTALPLLTDIQEPSIWNRIMRYEKNTRFAEKQIW